MARGKERGGGGGLGQSNFLRILHHRKMERIRASPDYDKTFQDTLNKDN